MSEAKVREKRLTVVTTTYRSAAHLGPYLEGLGRLEELDALTVLLVMNEPDEAERAILEPYRDSLRAVLEIVEVPLESIGASLNRGLFAARTEYCAFLDVDDVRIPDSFGRQMAVLDADATADFTYGDFVIVHEHGATEGQLVETIEFCVREFGRGCHASPTQLFRRSLLDRAGGFDEQFRSGGDFEFQVRAAANCRFVKTPGLMLYKTSHADSASADRMQPLERTAVELRYGLYDKTMELGGYEFVDEARSYRLDQVLAGGEWHDIEGYVPGYRAMLAERAPALAELEARLEDWKRWRFVREPAYLALGLGVRALRRLRGVFAGGAS